MDDYSLPAICPANQYPNALAWALDIADTALSAANMNGYDIFAGLSDESVAKELMAAWDGLDEKPDVKMLEQAIRAVRAEAEKTRDEEAQT